MTKASPAHFRFLLLPCITFHTLILYTKFEECPAKIHCLFIEFFNTIFLQGQFFITKGKVVPVIKHCIATWAACDVVSVVLIISL